MYNFGTLAQSKEKSRVSISFEVIFQYATYIGGCLKYLVENVAEMFFYKLF